MKTNRLHLLLTAAFGLTLISTAGCAEKEKVADGPQPAAKPVAVVAPAPAPGLVYNSAAATPPENAGWADIKDCTFETRSQFFTGLTRLQARVDQQISELTAKRATMTGTTGTKEWDFAMKEMADARMYLKSMGEELGKAGRETWDQQKDKVGLAWVRTQDAYGKVKSSTTS